MRRRLLAKMPSLVVLVALMTGLSSETGTGAAVIEPATVRHVSPSGSDDNDGSPTRPFKTIQKAVEDSQPGGVIQLAPGRYAQDFATVRGGVTISGPRDAIVVGGGGARIAQIKHDDIRLTGFTIDGRHASSDSASSYRDKLIYAMSTTARDGVDRLRIDNMALRNAGGECVRLRYFVTGAVVEGNTISNCGIYDFRFNGGGKNGEGIYLGTAPEQRGLNGAPTTDPDVSRDNIIRNNTLDTQGNECVDVKEDSTANLVQANSCTGQKDPDSAGLDSRGSGNTFRDNTTFDNVGAGVRLGGDTESDGIDNTVVDNVLRNNQRGGIKVMRVPQRSICGNDFTEQGRPFIGTYAASFDPGAQCVVATARYNALSPSRILDTRSGNGAPAAKLGAGAVLDVQVSGRGGVPTAGVSAVALNLTVTAPSAAGSLTAWPTGQARPDTVSVSHGVNQTIAGLVVVKAGPDGKVSLSSSNGETHAIADVVGWYGEDSAAPGARYNPLVPSRVLDTRTGNGAPTGQLGPGATLDLQVSGRGGVPTTGVSAAVLNLTVTSPTTGSHLTVWPTGQARPTASNLNYVNRQTVANLVMAKVDAGGRVSIYNNQGDVHVIADVVGWYGEDGAALGSLYGPLVPERILDTRSGNGALVAKLGPGSTLELQVTGRGGVPATGVSATVVTVTATDASTGSHLTVWPTGQPRPTASNLNFSRGPAVSNSVSVPVGTDGKVSIFNSAGEVHVTADVAGWYSQ